MCHGTKQWKIILFITGLHPCQFIINKVHLINCFDSPMQFIIDVKLICEENFSNVHVLDHT